MSKEMLPLDELSIRQVFYGTDKTTTVYEIPIYQRNFAWEKGEITTLIQDIYDAFIGNIPRYFIGTLVSYKKEDNVFEIIDGQQRLTAIRLILGVLDNKEPTSAEHNKMTNELRYRARKKSDDTIKSIPNFNIIEKDISIENGYVYAQEKVNSLLDFNEWEKFKEYFLDKVMIIHYQVPKDIDLNHYFEIMNSRGEQLEKHEIVKARLLDKLKNEKKASKLFSIIWDCCSNMGAYMQQIFRNKYNNNIFIGGQTILKANIEDFDSLLAEYNPITNSEEQGNSTINKQETPLAIIDIIKSPTEDKEEKKTPDKVKFQPIIDFPNFLLIVLKITLYMKNDTSYQKVTLDDKELLTVFNYIYKNSDTIKYFAYNLLKAKYFLDNYIIHTTETDDSNNPWKLQVLEICNKKVEIKNLTTDDEQQTLSQLLSMFEVSYSARQNKNYLFYCLLFLLKQDLKKGNRKENIKGYADFVENLAKYYFSNIYLDNTKLNDNKMPKPNSFDDVIKALEAPRPEIEESAKNNIFKDIYGDGINKSNGIPQFIFNYLDFKLWQKYAEELRGKDTKQNDLKRKAFFNELGCNEFDLSIFDKFYFSRTRNSLEHYYPQAEADKEGKPTKDQINCFGNYAMIGREANSSGSNWDPLTKLIHYLDKTGKIPLISTASLKFRIMMQVCKDEGKWEWAQIKDHQEKMINILCGSTKTEDKNTQAPNTNNTPLPDLNSADAAESYTE